MLILAAFVLANVLPVNAQVLIKDSLIQILPFFSKKDTMIYQRTYLVLDVKGTDTITTKHTTQTFRVICTKEDEKKGYQLEYTLLDFKDSLFNEKSDLKAKINNAFSQAFIGSTQKYTIDTIGQNLKLLNPDKVIKDATIRMGYAWDSISKISPLITSIFPKASIVLIAKNAIEKNVQMGNYGEMSEMFQFHGNAYPYEKEVEFDLTSEISTRPSSGAVIAVDCPEEGEEKADYDNYALIGGGISYQDALQATIINIKNTTGQDVTKEQLEELLGDKMPTGEVECNESFENNYFNDGWPMELWYSKTSKLNEKTGIEIKYIEWIFRSVGNE